MEMEMETEMETTTEMNSNTYSKIVERVSRNRLLLACGAAAGVSSGFNAPLSGVFFALEVVQAALPPLSIPYPQHMDGGSGSDGDGDGNGIDDDTMSSNIRGSETIIELQQQSLSGNPGSITAILISSVVSTLVSRIFLGDELALQLSVLTYDIPTPLTELPLYLLLGVACGMVSVAFSQTATLSKAVLEGEAGPQMVREGFGTLPPFVLPVIGGMTCGGVGYFYPQVLFFGYETLNGLLGNENLPTELLVTLLVAKIVTTAVSAGSGLVGGTLAPSLFLGGE
jgi:H+/Cl- antiporter ClcA